jgi:hypothetical protein
MSKAYDRIGKRLKIDHNIIKKRIWTNTLY